MKTRIESARHAERIFNSELRTVRNKEGKVHFGWQELRDIMDFIYGGPPVNDEEILVNNNEWRKVFK